MFKQTEEREADADCDADFEVPEEGGEEDEGHEGEFYVAAYGEEESDVVWRFFD